ncbi:ScbA/BarX family gamma-butyrolactone biosynthesis protein [Streptomyces sp. NPDC093261]|uniref:ScbA/BarX family gamma-butyrolactone biosynthesis protein n=1 Tax=Streptomyces sp. NPDC093261 TaxID=3366037 RepID=UPI0037F6FCBF
MTQVNTSLTAASGAVVAEHRLRFDGSVERSLVHRHAASEVFLTDHVALGGDCFAVAARLPSAHRYFNDDPLSPAPVDPMLLLECSRQAGTLVAHCHLGVPMDAAFLITEWAVELDDESLLVPPGPGELMMVIEARDLRQRGGRLLGATLVSELYLAGRRVGTSTVITGYPTRSGYESFRTKGRNSPAPLSDSMPPRRLGARPESRTVGRTLEENVTISAVRRTDGQIIADLDVPVAHPVFYDHPLDHVPATALLEAARQAALLALTSKPGAAGEEAARPRVKALRARFQRFVELDSPTEVSARPEQAGDSGSVAVAFEQGGATACTCEVIVSTPSASPVPPADALGGR